MVTLDWNAILFIFGVGMIAGMVVLRALDGIMRWWRGLADIKGHKLNQDVAAPEMKMDRKPSAVPEEYWLWMNLTGREREVAELAAKGKKNPEIAEKLDISTKTVDTHMQHVFRKLGVNSRAAVREAYRHIVEYEKETQDRDT